MIHYHPQSDTLKSTTILEVINMIYKYDEIYYSLRSNLLKLTDITKMIQTYKFHFISHFVLRL